MSKEQPKPRVDIGNFIENLRRKRGLTQKEVSHSLNCSLKHYSMFESGLSGSLEFTIKVLAFYECELQVVSEKSIIKLS